ncbi:MAG: YkgJ family cysteine cluster protein [Armatimonadetes bacterium]|nr:YkgJ family cysteine cluster protein [Armatimonadota bacterium]
MDHDLITDLDRIAALAEEQEDENTDFRAFVKWQLDWEDEEVDAVVKATYEEVAALIDCQTCGNCCRELSWAAEPLDIVRLARRLGTSEAEFAEQYLTYEHGEKVLNVKPCPFLDGCRCSVYEDRPGNCRDFPYLDRPGFSQRLFSVLSNAEICPIVYNTIERLKDRLGFHRGRRGRRRH